VDWKWDFGGESRRLPCGVSSYGRRIDRCPSVLLSGAPALDRLRIPEDEFVRNVSVNVSELDANLGTERQLEKLASSYHRCGWSCNDSQVSKIAGIFNVSVQTLQNGLKGMEPHRSTCWAARLFENRKL